MTQLHVVEPRDALERIGIPEVVRLASQASPTETTSRGAAEAERDKMQTGSLCQAGMFMPLDMN